MTVALPPVFTVHDAMVAAGVDDTDNFDGQSSAQRLAEDLFDNNFTTCMDKSHDDIESDFKSFSALTQAQGQVRTIPRVKKRIKAFVQWTRDEIRLGRDPSLSTYLVVYTTIIMRHYNTHAKFIKKSSTLSDAAKPVTLTKEVKWTD